MSEELETKNFSRELKEKENKAQLEKAKQNIVYVSMFSVVMLFAGLTSAYIVSMGDTFWLKFTLPTPFWISTVLILLSSIAFVFAVSSSKKGQLAKMKIAVSIAFILGLGFVYYQFKGYGVLIDNGIHPANNAIIVTDGRYGDYFEVKYKGDFIEIDGNKFLLKGEKMTKNQLEAYQAFMSQFLVVDEKESFVVNHYGKDFVLYYENTPLRIEGNALVNIDSTNLKYTDRVRLKDLAINVKDLRGDFYAKGEMGKDFHVYYKGKQLEYKDRNLQMNGKVLKNYMQMKAMESADTASSYLYLITFLHLIHIIFTLFYVVRLVISSFAGVISADNNIKMRMGASFWHFLGLLWLYLLLFLLFIH